ncbi:MAG: hypothetical protein AAFY88_12105 [Acidobacteriota bacterium]
MNDEAPSDQADPRTGEDLHFDPESGSAGIETTAEMATVYMHLELGGALELHRGVASPAGYGDDAAEDEALRHGWTLRHRMGLELLEMGGEDRVRFLNSQATCDVKDLAPGTGVFGFFTSPKGRIEADVQVLALDDRLWLELPPGRGEPIRERLEKYKVIDRVELESLELTSLCVAGPLAAERLSALVGELPAAPHGHRKVTLHGIDARLVREPSLPGGEGAGEIDIFALWIAPGDLEALLDALLDQDQGPTLIGWRTWDQLRVEAGWSIYGIDYDGTSFPQESGHGERGVCYTKGCYLGQEVVARIHYRGGVQRHLRRLTLLERSKSGRELHLDGKKVGVLGTVARLTNGEYAALAIVHHKAAPGARLDVVRADTGEATGVTAVVEALDDDAASEGGAPAPNA